MTNHIRARSAECRGPKSATAPAEVEAMARAAYHKRGVVMVPLDEVACDWTRRAIEAWANERYGKRKERV